MGAGFPQSGNNLLELEAVAAQHSEGIKCHWISHLKMIHFAMWIPPHF